MYTPVCGVAAPVLSELNAAQARADMDVDEVKVCLGVAGAARRHRNKFCHTASF
jgi:hypothetical protein